MVTRGFSIQNPCTSLIKQVIRSTHELMNINVNDNEHYIDDDNDDNNDEMNRFLETPLEM